MKKAIFSIMAILTVFAMVTGCGGGSKSPVNPAEVTITFVVNVPDEYDGQTPVAPEALTIPYGTGLDATTLTTAPSGAEANLLFLGWFRSPTGGTRITTADVFYADTPIYAQWRLLAADDIVITFKYNYGANSPDIADEPFDYQAITKQGQPIAEADWPEDPVRTGYTFEGWKQFAGGGNTYTSTSTTWPDGTGGSTLNTVWAFWVPIGGEPEETPPDNIDLTGVEKVTTGNQAIPIYVFTLPAGKNWEDYKEITAKVMVGPNQLTKYPNHWRLLGNYEYGDFTYGTLGAGPNTGTKLAMAKYLNSGDKASGNKYAPYIMINNGSLANNNSKTLSDILTDFGQPNDPWTWFTIEHDFVNSEAHGSFDATNRPADTAHGPFFFALGLPASGEANSLTFYVKDVTLVGYTGTEDLKGSPLYVVYDKGDGEGDVTYAAFAGWESFADGAFGNQYDKREMMDGSTVTPIKVQAAITFDLNYDGASEAEVKKTIKGSALGANWPDDPEANPDGDFFAGWYTESDGSGDRKTKDDVFTADTTLYAKWAPPIDITLDPQGGKWGDSTANKTETIGTGGSLTDEKLAAPTKDGYRFDGWYGNAAGTGDKITSATEFPAATTIYAKWVETVKVTFKLNYLGGADIIRNPDKGQAIGEWEDFPAPTWNAFYTLVGWNLRSDGKGIPVTSATKFNAATTVYAIWKASKLAPADLVYVSTDPALEDVAANTTSIKLKVDDVTPAPADGVFANYFTHVDLHWTLADMDIPAGYDLTSYDSYTIKIKAYTDNDYTDELDLTTLAANTNVFQLKFSTHISDMGDTYSGNDRVLYNVGSKSDGTPPRIYGIKENFPAKVINDYPGTPILAMFLQGGGNLKAQNIKSVEITDIIFHTALSGAVGVNNVTLDDPMFGPGTLSDTTWNVSTGDITFNLPGYDGYRWLVNGVQQGAGDALTLKVADYQTKINTNIAVTVFAVGKDGDNPYTKTIVVTVKR